MKIKSVLIIAAVSIFAAQGAYALSLKFKKEQARMQKQVDKEVGEITKSCGCTPAIEINWESFTVKDDFLISTRNMRDVSGGMAKVCKDFKKEVCAGVKTVKISKGDKLDKSLKAGVMDITIPSPDRGWGASGIQKLIEENL